MSTFDPSTFMNQTFYGTNSTSRTPIPEGEYPMIAKKVEVDPWQSKKDPTKAGLKLNVQWAVDSAAVREVTGLSEPTCRQSIMLDLTETGGLDMGKGKNVGLGRLREAVGLNTPGQPFSFAMIEGRAAKGRVAWRVADDGTETIYDEVKAVTKL
jgi:hypothetical protein